MKMLKKIQSKTIATFFIIVILAITFMSIYVAGDPTGAVLANISSSQKNSSDPGYGNHSKGAIHTVNLGATQQNTKWKAYVGNVSSSFVLDDEDNYSIFQWTITSFTGQIYITRNSTISWDNVACATPAEIALEDTTISHNSASADSVNRTFTTQGHKQFFIGGRQINQNSCYSVATNVDNSPQTASSTTPFTELLLWDSDGKMLYTTFVENDANSYRNDGVTTYDFQAIVPESGNAGTPAFTYYFYIELTST
jgi:hypothetical protein